MWVYRIHRSKEYTWSSFIDYPSAEKQSMYSTAPPDWAKYMICAHILLITFYN